MSAILEYTNPGPVVVTGGGGANARHFADALGIVREDHPIVVGEMQPPDPNSPVPCDAFYRLDQAEGKENFRTMMRMGVFASYLSTPPEYHAPGLKEHLGYVAAGSLGFVVVTKPAVRNVEEMRAVGQSIEEIEAATGFEGLAQRLFTHEHYLFKEEWQVFRESLGKVVDYLGRPTNILVSIQEERTIESENRGAACADGAFGDLVPHAISLGLNAVDGINQSAAFEVSPSATYSPLERVRDQDSKLDPGVESGFRFRAVSNVKSKMDDATAAPHELQFTLQGGKGLVDEKKIAFTFVDEAGVSSLVTVDFIAKKITVPDAVAHLFPQTEGFKDNGYGASVARGLKGDPANNFQSWEDARKVIKIGEYVRRISSAPPIVYALLSKGRSIETILD